MPEPEPFDFPALPDWVEPYVAARPRGPRTPLEFHDDAAQEELQRMIREVVEVEGPVAVEVLLTRVRSAWGLSRAGGRARDAFEKAIKGLTRRQVLARQADDFFEIHGRSRTCVRSADSEVAETVRKIEEIPRAELTEAMRRLVAEVHAISEDELTARVAAIFGWARRGADIADALRRAVRRLVQSGDLVRTENGLVPGGTGSVGQDVATGG